jgi:hypothetical protein
MRKAVVYSKACKIQENGGKKSAKISVLLFSFMMGTLPILLWLIVGLLSLTAAQAPQETQERKGIVVRILAKHLPDQYHK